MENLLNQLVSTKKFFDDFNPKAKEPITIKFWIELLPEMRRLHYNIIGVFKEQHYNFDATIKNKKIKQIIFESFYLTKETIIVLEKKYIEMKTIFSQNLMKDEEKILLLFLQINKDLYDLYKLDKEYKQIINYVYNTK